MRPSEHTAKTETVMLRRNLLAALGCERPGSVSYYRRDAGDAAPETVNLMKTYHREDLLRWNETVVARYPNRTQRPQTSCHDEYKKTRYCTPVAFTLMYRSGVVAVFLFRPGATSICCFGRKSARRACHHPAYHHLTCQCRASYQKLPLLKGSWAASMLRK